MHKSLHADAVLHFVVTVGNSEWCIITTAAIQTICKLANGYTRGLASNLAFLNTAAWIRSTDPFVLQNKTICRVYSVQRVIRWIIGVYFSLDKVYMRMRSAWKRQKILHRAWPDENALDKTRSATKRAAMEFVILALLFLVDATTRI